MLLGIHAKAQSGKSTAAQYLRSKGWEEISFAAPIRAFTAHLLQVSLEELEQLKETPVGVFGGRTPRYFMQQLGTEFGRSISPTLWIDLALRNIKPSQNYVVSDVRFTNEAEAILKWGGKIIQLERDGAGTPSKHVSEEGIPHHYIHTTIYNNQTIEELHKQLDEVVKGL